MKILSIAVKIPSKQLTNEDILEMIARHSNGVSKTKLKSYQRIVERLFKFNGSKVMYVPCA